MSILELPVETVRAIFLIAVQQSFPSLARLTDTSDADAILGSATLTNISKVCRNWREIALSDPALWSTINVSLPDPSEQPLLRALSYSKVSLERSGDMPLTCLISFADRKMSNAERLILQRIVLALTDHQERWERIGIDLPKAFFIDEELEATAMPYFDLCGEKMSKLVALRLGLGKATRYITTGPSACSSLTSLHLDGLEFGTELAPWLHRAPNLRELRSDAYNYEKSVLQAIDIITMEKLRILDVEPGALRFLQCPALENISLRHFTASPEGLPHFLAFVLRSAPPLCALHISSHIMSMDTLPDYLQAIPTLQSLSLKLYRRSSKSFLELLSKRVSSDEGDGNKPYCWLLPELEHLELVGCLVIPKRFSAFISSRWTSRERKLKSATLSLCWDGFQDLSEFNFGDEPASLSWKWEPMLDFIKEGFLFTISSGNSVYMLLS